jgi:hypothetical protein
MTVPRCVIPAYGSGRGTWRLLDRWVPPTTVIDVQNHPDHTDPDEGEDRGEEQTHLESGSDEELHGVLPFTGALGVDPEQPDPGCAHDWRNLHFLEDDEGIACMRCGRGWVVDEGDSRDAVLALWNSTRRAIEDLTIGQERLTRIVEEITGSVRCHWCQHWSDDTDEFVTVGRRRACPEHLGQLLAEVAPAAEDDVARVQTWLRGVLETRGDDVYTAWLAEKAAVECPEIADGPNALTIDDIGGRGIALPVVWSDRLGLPTRTDVDTASTRVARLLDLPRPISRPGRSFLLGALARVLRSWEIGAPLDAEALTDILMEVAPSTNRDRATIVLDLYREEMQVDGTVTGEMADDLVEALIGRAASEFSGLATASETNPDAGNEPNPR